MRRPASRAARAPRRCEACGKEPLLRDEVAICIKLLNAERYLCLDCLAEHLGVQTQDILDKIEQCKEDGCLLFAH